MEEKKDNNNNLEKVTSFQERSQVLVTTQTGLFNQPIIKTQFRLNKNQLYLLSFFANNKYIKWTRNLLKINISKKIHINTISNFLKESECNEWIKKERIIPGAEINTLLLYQKFPDTFEDKSICKDKRATYYTITKLGKEVFKINETQNSTQN